MCKPTYEELEQKVKELEKEASKRKQAEEKLEQHLASLLHYSSLAIITLNDKHRIISCNRYFENLFQFEEPEILGKKLDQVIARKEYIKDAMSYTKKALRGEAIHGSGRRYRKDGTLIDVEFIGVPVVIEGKVVGAYGIYLDVTARKQDEEALRESRDAYQTIFETTGTAMLIGEEDTTIFMINKEFEKLCGYSKEEVEGKKSWIEFLVKADLERLKGYHNVRMTDPNAGPPYYEFQFIDKQGNVKDCFITLSLIPGTKKTVGSLIDITARKRTEEALKESEEKYRTILESIEEGYYEVDITGNSTFVNDSLCKILGYPRDEIIGINNRTYMDEENAKRVYQDFNRAYKTEKPTKILDWEIIRKDTTKRHVETSVSLIKNSEGNPTGFRGIVRDITERKQAEEALKKSEERFRVLVEEFPLGVFLIDKDGHYRYINPKFIEMFGYTMGDIPTGRVWFRKAYPDQEYRDKVVSAWMSDRSESEVGEHRPRIFTVTCKDDSKKIIQFRAVTMEGGDQFVICEDITEQKNLEAQLIWAQRMEAIGTLAGGIAHDFNNILAVVIGYSELAKMKVPEGSDVISDLDEVLKAGNRAKNLVQQILTFSHQREEEKKPLQIHFIAKEALKLLRPSLPATIEIRQNITSTSAVLADPTQIHQVMMNLCTNAYHAMRDTGGVLEVSLSDVELDSDFAARHLEIHPGPYVKLTVSDTGHGIEKKGIDKIFDPYFTTKEKGEGTGMGLAVVHGIVKTYGGGITVYSELEKGTTFHVYLPRIEREVTAEPEEMIPLPMGKEQILFVDDEPAIVDIGKSMLEQMGYKVEVRTSPIEAHEAFRTQPDKFDLVITDMTMPKVTGDDLAKELMAIRPDIPIILCTGFSERITEEMAKALGIRAFVMKPFVMRDLANTIRRILDQEKEK